MMKRYRLQKVMLVPLLVLLVFMMTSNVSQAAGITWDGGGSTNNWSEAVNWSTDTVPGPSDHVTFDATSSKNATIDAAFGGTIRNLTINAGYEGVVRLGSQTLSIGNLMIQEAGDFDAETGTIILSHGSTVDSAASLYNLTLNIPVPGQDLTLNRDLAILNDYQINTVDDFWGAYTLFIGGDLINNNAVWDSWEHNWVFNGGTIQNITMNSPIPSGKSLTINAGTTLVETVADNNIPSPNITNNGKICKTRDMSAVGTGTNVLFGITEANLNATALGTLSDIEVCRIDSNHPQAIASVQTGRYYPITPTGSGFDLIMTLPFTGADANDKLCRYLGSSTDWNCDGVGGGGQVTRAGITTFSDWAVGDDAPLALTLGYFRAETNGDGVNFAWQTASEQGVAGFNLYAAGETTPLNSALIPSPAIDSVTPTDYRFTAPTTATVFYLDEVGIDGSIQRHGPFGLGEVYGVYVAGPEGEDETQSIFLPVVVR